MNRVQGEFDPKMAKLVEEVGLKLAGVLPADETIAEFDLEGKPTIQLPDDTQAVKRANEIFEVWIP